MLIEYKFVVVSNTVHEFVMSRSRIQNLFDPVFEYIMDSRKVRFFPYPIRVLLSYFTFFSRNAKQQQFLQHMNGIRLESEISSHPVSNTVVDKSATSLI